MKQMPTTIHARTSYGSGSTLVQQAGRQTVDVGNGKNNQWPGLLKVVIGLSIGHVVLLAVIAAVLGSFVSSHLQASLQEQKATTASRRQTPVDDAKFWCDIGLDKDGFERKFVSNEIGYGLFAKQEFTAGQFLLEYVGERISPKEAAVREKRYAKLDSRTHPRCYIFHYKFDGKRQCIDATNQKERLCRYANDAPKTESGCNASMKLKVFGNYPRLCLFASRHIQAGEEIRYDYGVSKEHLIWRKNMEQAQEASHDSDLDSNPFSVTSDSEQDCEGFPKGFSDADTSDAVDPSYRPKESEISETSCSAMSDIIPDTSENVWGSFLHQKARGKGALKRKRRGLVCSPEKRCDKRDIIPDTSENVWGSFLHQKARGKGALNRKRRGLVCSPEKRCDKRGVPNYMQRSETETKENNGLREVMPQCSIDGKVDAEKLVHNVSCDTDGEVSHDLTDKLTPTERCFQSSSEESEMKRQRLDYVSQNDIDGLKDKANTDPNIDTVNRNQSNNTENISQDGTTATCEFKKDQTKQSTAELTRSFTVSGGQNSTQLSDTETKENNGLREVIPQRSIDGKVDEEKLVHNVSCDIDGEVSHDSTDKLTTTERCLQSSSEETEIHRQRSDYNSQNDIDGLKDTANTDPNIGTINRNQSNNTGNIGQDDTTGTCELKKDQTKQSTAELTRSSTVTGLRCPVCNVTFKRKGALTTHTKSHGKKEEDYKRPSRVCPFCPTLTFHTQLPRHISGKHKDIPEVAEAIKLPQQSKERNECFEKFRKAGIFKYNKSQSATEEPNYIAERKTQTDLICCSNCKGFYGRQLFHRHKAACAKDKTSEPVAVHLDVFSNQQDEFSRVVLSCFRGDEIGNLCRNDPIIGLIGRRLFQTTKKKPDSVGETRKTVMNDMRLLARLYNVMKDNIDCQNAEALFLRKNFSALEQAIEIVTREEEILKHGVKNKIYYLLNNSREILVGHYFSLEMDEKAAEIEKFQKLLDLNKALIFGDAVYAVNINRQRKLRMPEQMADESDVKKLRQHICSTIERYTSEYEIIGPHEFIMLRDAVCSRVTLFNARRGGEPARLRLHQYEDIKTERWVKSSQKEKLEDWEQKLFHHMEVTYQAGKGDHLVSDFIPLDCRKGLDILADKENRRRAGVPASNDYIFANTQQSDYHVTGWSTINKMCEDAGIEKPCLLTATKQRHRISTIYSALDVPECERQYFYKHMGHTKDVNLGTYQYPQPVLAMTKVGRHLQDIDKALSLEMNTSAESRSSTPPAENMDSMPSTSSGISSEPFDGETVDRIMQASSIEPQTSKTRDTETTQHVPSESQDAKEQKSVPACRDYFKWSSEETEKIKKDFREWIHVSEGNPLPSKAVLLDYIDSKPGRYNLKQLKTKIMNEQNTQKKISKKRMENLMENK